MASRIISQERIYFRIRRSVSKALLLLLIFGATANVSCAENLATFTGSAVCSSCHPTQDADWKSSFHQQAMADATSATILGNFNNTKFTYNGTVSEFYRRGPGFYVRTDGPDGKLHEYKIDYTFGVFPLQQYLVKFPDGRLQALSIAWDSRAAKDGGQRWFHLYPKEKVDYRDVLHWTKHSQNWNSMCAECHSTNLQKNYDPATKKFNTTWSDINVGCEACHGPASLHMAWADKKETERSKTDLGFAFTLKSTPLVPSFDAQDGRTLPQRDRALSKQMDACGRCHSRRAVIAPEYRFGQPLMATHFPSLLTADLYHSDGQIKDEVYEYGSFSQSKMYLSGVGCSDCHNPHSLKLRVPGNAVCGQCHTATKYDTTQHHFHKAGSAGAECKSCHMPEKKYMVVDPRFDHSMRIPTPVLSAKIGAPDPCISCHADKTAQWADEQIRQRFGPAKSLFHNYGDVFTAARAGDRTSSQQLIEILADSTRPGIVRATAAYELGPYLTAQTIGVIEKALSDGSPELRAAAIDALEVVPPEIKVKLAAPLLNDAILGVRIEAARVLASVPADQIPTASKNPLEVASKEYIASQIFNAESPQAQVNIGVFYAMKGMTVEAEKAYHTAVELEPKFMPAYVNLADLYRQTGRDKEGRAVLEQAIREVPNNAEVHYALGLLLVRLGDKQKAIKELQSATLQQPENPHFAYVYVVALNDFGKKAEARKYLAEAKKRSPSSPELAALEGQLK